jgi:hypothetical protein
MPSLKVHCAISRDRTGYDFEALHKWIDALYKTKGINHRMERHSLNDMDAAFVRQKWGEKGFVEWLFHIAVDNLETAYINACHCYSDRNAYNFFKFGMIPGSKFIRFHVGLLTEDALLKEFREDYKIIFQKR